MKEKEHKFIPHEKVMAAIDAEVEKIATKLRGEGYMFDLENKPSEFVLRIDDREFHFTKVSDVIAELISRRVKELGK